MGDVVRVARARDRHRRDDPRTSRAKSRRPMDCPANLDNVAVNRPFRRGGVRATSPPMTPPARLPEPPSHHPTVQENRRWWWAGGPGFEPGRDLRP